MEEEVGEPTTKLQCMELPAVVHLDQQSFVHGSFVIIQMLG